VCGFLLSNKKVYTILVWNTISGSSNLDIYCYHCLVFTLIFHLKVLINFFFIIFIIIIINSIIGVIIIITTTTITITIFIILTTTTSIIIVVVVVVVTIVVVSLLLSIIYTINLYVVNPGLTGLFITSTLLHLGEASIF
jgi:hypothetical protein